ncbi:MAG: endonuclease Q family protein [Patescibacteria group bacterium]|nr:endonuclease Q family protein [Patescibacteria group bacterium]
MRFIADLHFHSKYSRAVSPKMELDNLAEWGEKKGVAILTSADFTHPLWFTEMEKRFLETSSGVYRLKNSPQSPFFIISAEVSLIFPGHRIHLIVFSPNLKTAKEINRKLSQKGFNLSADGRPIFGISAVSFVGMISKIDPQITFIPAHIWTPWFSLYGSRSGFGSINQCFERFASKIPAIETGLSSDPLMNWQIKELDQKRIVSFSDSHSLKNLGRNATVFELPENFRYSDLVTAFKTPYRQGVREKKPHVASTIEFHPEEGRYHYTGHRKCSVCHSPEDSQKLGITCPVCGKLLTVGVAHQVKKLSRAKTIRPKIKIVGGLKIFCHPENRHHPFISLIPLREIIAEAEKSGPESKKVAEKYSLAIEKIGPEIEILIKTPVTKIAKSLGEKVAEGIIRNRTGQVVVEPGYDGLYGKVKIWPKGQKKDKKEQISLF